MKQAGDKHSLTTWVLCINRWPTSRSMANEKKRLHQLFPHPEMSLPSSRPFCIYLFALFLFFILHQRFLSFLSSLSLLSSFFSFFFFLFCPYNSFYTVRYYSACTPPAPLKKENSTTNFAGEKLNKQLHIQHHAEKKERKIKQHDKTPAAYHVPAIPLPLIQSIETFISLVGKKGKMRKKNQRLMAQI